MSDIEAKILHDQLQDIKSSLKEMRSDHKDLDKKLDKVDVNVAVLSEKLAQIDRRVNVKSTIVGAGGGVTSAALLQIILKLLGHN